MPDLPAPPPFADAFAQALLDTSLTAFVLLRPRRRPDGEDIADFDLAYLNAAGQRMVGLPARPEGTFLTYFPTAEATGVMAFYRRVFRTGEAGYHEINYQADGLYNYFRLSARRHADLLVVSFTDTADQDRSAVEQALRESPAREQAARAEAEAQRRRLHHLLMDLPAITATYRGPAHVYELVSPSFQHLFPARDLPGRPIREVMPELAGQGMFELLDHVYQTGEPYYGQEVPTEVDYAGTGQLERRYHNLYFQPTRDADGRIDGLLSFAYDVTEQVLARRQLWQLNQELEARVAARTQEAAALQAEALAVARRQVQERAALFHMLADTPAAVALLRGPQHQFEYINTAYQQLFPGRQLIGRPVAAALPETEEAGILALLNRVYRTGETFYGTELPMRLAPAEGRPAQPVYYTFTYQAYREEGRIAGVSIFAFDVTEQVQARQQREAERQQLQNLFMEAPAPIVILDGPDLVFQLVNPAYQRIFPGRALLGKPVLDAVPEFRDSPVPDLMRQVYATGASYVAQELPLPLARHAGGPVEETYWTFIYQARRNAQGAVDGVLGFAHDVTDQVLARRVVEERETSFRLLADNVPGTLWVTNPAGECTYLSAGWYATTGQTLAEGLGLGWTRAVHPDDAAGAGAKFLAANARRGPYHCLFRLRQRDGQYRWVTDNGLPRFDATGAYEGMVGSVVDVHEQKLAELALQRLTAELRSARDDAQDLATELADSNQQLTRTNVDLDNFIYIASHDLKAPISNIEGLLYLLQDELPTDGVQAAPTLERMFDSVERFKRTIEHLTEVSKLQKVHDVPLTAVDVAAVVEDVRQDLLPLVQSTGARLDIDVAARPAVLFAEKNLRSVVYNLLHNALKYHSPDRVPRVEVRAYTRLDYTVLEVHDNGLGIEPLYLPRLFAMFQRFHTHVEGTGIGLYMVKRMVDNAGGRIEVVSEPEVGSTFRVYFPH